MPEPEEQPTNKVDWAPIKQKTGAIAMTALCFITFMLVAGVSTEGPRVGAINVLLWALSWSLPASAVIGLVTALVLRHRQLQGR
ncbi:MAG: hypothetical protein KI792_08080 [Alphaproteobacteria bacterium]|nr:hypothetical protein [Alphaproteobacteria bacterium SS10]